jgi:hypothetical protein
VKVIPLTRGKTTLVDDEDYPYVLCISRNWCAYRNKDIWYATAWFPGAGKAVKMHQVVMGFPAPLVVDHINGDGLDNQKSNLRICTKADNTRKARLARRSDNASGFRGTCWDKAKGKWMATIHVNSVQRFLGYFDCVENAALAYDEAARELHGEFATLNFPEEAAK